MNSQKQNMTFQFTQFLQVGLLMTQGMLLIVSESKIFYEPIWIGLAMCSLVQFLLIFKYPKKIETIQLVDRSAMFRLRLIAMVPYVLILVGLLVAV